MIPTGAADPNGLRRCALGIIRILLEFGLRLDVSAIFDKARQLYGTQEWKLPPEQAQEKLQEFFVARLRNYYLTQGQDTLLVDAVLNASAADLPDTQARLAALTSFSQAPGYAEAVQTFKRVANIVRKQAAAEDLPETWDAALLQEEAEKALARTLADLLPRLDSLCREGQYSLVLESLKEVRPVVDAFFDGTMVMCEDSTLRHNRLTMLKSLGSRFARLADFAALQI